MNPANAKVRHIYRLKMLNSKSSIKESSCHPKRKINKKVTDELKHSSIGKETYHT